VPACEGNVNESINQTCSKLQGWYQTTTPKNFDLLIFQCKSTFYLNGPPPHFRITPDDAHDLLARISLTYLLSVNEALPKVWETLDSLPFMRYASEYWHVHVKNCQENRYLTSLILKLFDRNNENSLRNAIFVCDPENRSREPYYPETKFVSQLYYASLFGFVHVCQDIVKNGTDVNAQGGMYGTALQAASFWGHRLIVQSLLEGGADPNARAGHYGNALQAATFGGHESVFQLLLESGAGVNVQGRLYGNLLQLASSRGHELIVRCY